jgi:hypothetical protein
VFTLETRERRALVCPVGDGPRHASWVAAKVLSVLGDVSAVSHDASRDSLRLVVGEECVGEVVGRLRRELFEGAPAAQLDTGGHDSGTRAHPSNFDGAPLLYVLR